VVAGSNPVSPTFENLLGFNPNVGLGDAQVLGGSSLCALPHLT